MIKKMVCFDNDLKYLIEDKRDFVIIKSSNTKRIKILDSDENNKIFYTDTKMNMKVHHIVRKLKKELQPYLYEINLFMLDKKGEYYYSNSNLGDFCAREVYNVDISSAYLTALKNAHFISDKLYTEIFDLPKKDRLICLGLLAYQPVHFYYENGIFKSLEPIKNDFRNFFFYCVYEVSEVIKEIVSLLGGNHIFSWVDGVYFESNDFLKDMVENAFKERFYATKFEKLTNFQMEQKKDFFRFTFDKEKGKKQIDVPTHKKKERLDKGKAFVKFSENPSFENALNYLNYE